MLEPAADLAGALLMAAIAGIAARLDRNERSIHNGTLCSMGAGAAAFLCTKWAVFGILPAVSDIVLMALYAAMLGAMLWGKVFVARGDIAVIMVTSMLVPSLYGIPTVVITLGAALVVATAYYVTRTLAANVSEFASTRRVFGGIDDTAVRKMAAFFIVHRRSPGERFCFAGETVDSGRRRLVLLPRNLDSIDIEARTEYVIAAVPFMVPYFAGTCALALVAVLGLT